MIIFYFFLKEKLFNSSISIGIFLSLNDFILNSKKMKHNLLINIIIYDYCQIHILFYLYTFDFSLLLF